MGLLKLGSKDIGIDLGTSNILITVKGRGIVLREPAVIAIDEKTNDVIAVGNEAKEMLGKTPEGIKAIKPIADGVIADFFSAELILKSMLKKVFKRYNIGKPRVVVGEPSGITEVEERAIKDAILKAGAREVYLIEEPMAAAIGAGMNISEPTGNMIVDIGGGTTEVALISLGGIVLSDSIRVAGDNLDQDIINYVKKEMNLSIGEATAEQIKERIGCAMPLMTDMSIEIRGRDLDTGLPKNLNIKSSQVQEAMSESISKIIDLIKSTLEKTPPELASDLVERGIMISGGGALIQNIDKLISKETNMPVYISSTPLDSVVIGTSKTVEDIQKLKGIFANSRMK